MLLGPRRPALAQLHGWGAALLLPCYHPACNLAAMPLLPPGNVLLTASDKDTRGFTAKVVDFGLSRVCSGDYLRTRTLGCAEYM